MKLQDHAIAILKKKSPLVAHMLGQVRLEYDFDSHPYHPTVHLIAPEGSYAYEQLHSSAVWPKVHAVIMGILGHDFTLNFKHTTKGAPHGKEKTDEKEKREVVLS